MHTSVWSALVLTDRLFVFRQTLRPSLEPFENLNQMDESARYRSSCQRTNPKAFDCVPHQKLFNGLHMYCSSLGVGHEVLPGSQAIFETAQRVRKPKWPSGYPFPRACPSVAAYLHVCLILHQPSASCDSLTDATVCWWHIHVRDR